MAPEAVLAAALLAAACWGPPTATAEYARLFRVQEGVPAGTRIGFIGEAEVGCRGRGRVGNN
jgi:hypothetical protein